MKDLAYYQQSLQTGPQTIGAQPSLERIERYAGLVKYIAGRIAIGLPKHVDFDDLIGFGVLGLADALVRFQPDRGAKFETYASVRIKGAIFDGLRKMDWVPTSVRAKAKELESVITGLEARLGRNPEPKEIAAELGISLNDYFSRLDEIKATNLISLEESVLPEVGENRKLVDCLSDTRVELQFQQIENEETKTILVQAIEKLSEKEKLVISLYYYNELTLKEIAAVLKLSESRVSQIHTQAILRLRGRLSRAKKKLF